MNESAQQMIIDLIILGHSAGSVGRILAFLIHNLFVTAGSSVIMAERTEVAPN